jgi:hypothetical protein
MPRSIFDLAGGGGGSTPSPSARSGRQSIFDLAGQSEEPTPDEPGLLSRVARGIPQPVKTTVGTVLDVLGRPGAATAGAVDAVVQGENPLSRIGQNLTGKRRDTFDEVLEHSGMKDSIGRNVLGFAGDVVLDPLNLVGVGELGKVAKLAKLDTVGAKALELVPEGVKTFGTAVKDALGEKFIPRYGMDLKAPDVERLNAIGRDVKSPDEAAEALRQFQKERSTIPTRVEKDIIERYKGTDPEFRQGRARGHGCRRGQDPEVDAKVLEQSKKNDELFNREVDAGVQKEQNYRSDYAPADYSRSKSPQKGDDDQSALGHQCAQSLRAWSCG